MIYETVNLDSYVISFNKHKNWVDTSPYQDYIGKVFIKYL